MKQVYKDKIINIKNTEIFDNKFLFKKLLWEENILDKNNNNSIDIVYMSDLLEQRKNLDILNHIRQKPAMWSMLYSAKDELEIFIKLFNNAIKNNKKLHIIWVSLEEEIKILEKYYEELWFLRDDINCFSTNFSIPLVSVSVKVENLIWSGSDYKSQKEKIFFNPPIRDSSQTKAMFKWINRWVIAWIYFENFNTKNPNFQNIIKFLEDQIKDEHILAINLAKVLWYNMKKIWFSGKNYNLIIKY